MAQDETLLHADWSLVFWSFRIMLCPVEKDCFKLTNNNNNNKLKTMIVSYEKHNFSTGRYVVISEGEAEYTRMQVYR